uniref:[F-actin]-monooxygenase MICAL1-3-like Rossman domain-containing protein n=1 Tax=Haptolina brevifila TaxID=156173 RepID=A0A7S2NAN0_9EUKA
MSAFSGGGAGEVPLLDGAPQRASGTRNAAFSRAAALFGGGGEAGRAEDDEPIAADLEIGSLDFKPDKSADYQKGAGQGRLNYMQTPSLDSSFVLTDGSDPPEGATSMLPFSCLFIAEGEWSGSSTKLGVWKAIDRFSLAIGLVINMIIDPTDEASKKKESFHESSLGPVVSSLAAESIQVENVEYLRGETHYIAVTVKKISLLQRGVLLQDRSALNGAPLLGRANVDDQALLSLARVVATHVGLPETTQFAQPHPAKLFDFSTRARCLVPFKVLGVARGGSSNGDDGGSGGGGGGGGDERVVDFELAAQPFLASAESVQLSRSSEEANREVQVLVEELSKLDAEIEQATAKAQQAAIELGSAAGKEVDSEAAVAAATSVGKQRRAEVQKKLVEKEKVAAIAQQADRRWKESQAAAMDANRRVAVFPIGDSLLEPFWPQGLGSNRGFHSALDACFAVRVMKNEGLAASLLDRAFSYDVMINQPFAPGTIEPGSGWRSDYLSRYAPSVLSSMVLMYDNPNARRLYKGRGAVPPRISKMKEAGTLAGRKR